MPRRPERTGQKGPEAVRILWEEGFFKSWVDQDKVAARLTQRGNNFRDNTLRMALARSRFLISRRKNNVTEYIQTKPAISKEVDKIETELFDDKLLRKFGKSFETEITDLQINFGRSGNCTAFLLRKILEKLIYITFAKHNLQSKLEDKNVSGRVVGLDAMINIAATERVGGIPFLTSATAQAVRGLKFLGDASAHNPLADVDMKTILPQMPYIITAYKELLR